jgi:hypothetical protein
MRGATIRRLSERLLGKDGTTEIDAGDEIKVVNVNSEEILVDFPSAVQPEEILVDFPSCQSSLQDVHVGAPPALGTTDSVLEREGGIDADGFLGFPDGGRNAFSFFEGITAMLVSTTFQEDASKHNSLPSTIEILVTDEGVTAESQDDQNDGSWVGHNSQHFELQLTDVGTDYQKEYTDGTRPLEWVDEDGEEFEKPSNWVGDEESSAGDSEEYRQQIRRMQQERRASGASTKESRSSAASGQGRRRSTATGQGRRTSDLSTDSQGGLYPKENTEYFQKRQPNRAGRRSSLPAKLVPDPDPSTTANPFSAGFEFAKAVPAPLRHGRRPSLANTTYTFEKEAASRPRRARRASLDNCIPTNTTNTGYTDGLKAFGVKQHDIRRYILK